ncbi:hypothetical protein [Streptomyces liangshanensis]|uniref:Saccharopine dehydrogenase n=1 Tax=Streptomyces liangshanensis TaxID=2717324 RepID=A0A6G9GV90_9ACTN|nr:hypothetical protein [Streptomyces liangshanensis]QIQ01921.1 hypothetical protein HA039_06095 [Streptomyces liangshanensis]
MFRILVAGGYGLVGARIVSTLRTAGHAVEIVVGGRHPEEGAALAREWDARVVALDTDHPEDGLTEAGPVDLVVAAVQDPDDRLLRAALLSGAGHLGIVRKADTVGRTAITAAALARRPALIMGHWQAGAATFAALAGARDFHRVERVELAALFDAADPAGPMATADSGAFFGRTLLRRDGRWREVEEKREIRQVEREGAPGFAAQPMGVLDVPAVAAVTGAPDVRFDIGLGASAGTLAGGPASHEIFADLRGVDDRGRPVARRTVVSDPLGQAHLTAVGAVIGVERILGLDGAPPMAAGVAFPESVIDPARALDRLRAFGVDVTTAPLAPLAA